MPLGEDAHDREHAGSEGGGDEIRGGEGFAAAVVVHGSISEELLLRRPVGCRASQLPLVHDVDLNAHSRISVERGLKSRLPNRSLKLLCAIPAAPVECGSGSWLAVRCATRFVA